LPELRKKASTTKEQVVITPKTAPQPKLDTSLGNVEPIELKPLLASQEMRLFNEYIERYHSLGYKRPFGAHQRYFILSKDKRPLGCLLFAASALILTDRDRWIGWTKPDRNRRLHLIVNNTRFLIFPWVQIKNLASKSLSLAAKRIRLDWQSRYNYQPVLLETFVDAEKYRGTCYQAANWLLLGQTRGIGRMNPSRKKELSIKLMDSTSLTTSLCLPFS